MRLRFPLGLAISTLLAAPAFAQSATEGAPPPGSAQSGAASAQAEALKELQQLRAMREDLQRQMGAFDARIEKLETQLQAPPQAAQAAPPAATPEAAPANPAFSRFRALANAGQAPTK